MIEFNQNAKSHSNLTIFDEFNVLKLFIMINNFILLNYMARESNLNVFWPTECAITCHIANKFEALQCLNNLYPILW